MTLDGDDGNIDSLETDEMIFLARFSLESSSKWVRFRMAALCGYEYEHLVTFSVLRPSMPSEFF
jgi:hypothetical protein